jgi:hypothetical protein
MEIAPNRPAFGERSASTSTTRQILYRAESNAVDIRIEKAKKGLNIRGQVLGEGFDKASTRLSDDFRTFEAVANESSEFRFDNIPAGRYELTIGGEGVEITLKAIDIS